jgi:hypothetical protein
MKDLTVIYLTINKLPQKWTNYHLNVLKEAIGNCPVISISRIPIDFGTNIIQEPSENKSNIFRQMLKGAMLAKTDFVAIAEDDVLYPKEHFKLRPKLNEFGYNMHRWWLHTWDEPVYSMKRTLVNSTLIAPRKLLIEALQERFDKYPDGKNPEMAGELGKSDRKLGVTIRNVRELYSNVGVVQFDHDYFYGNDVEGAIERRHTKRPKPIKAIEIPKWGKAEDLRNYFK